MIVQNAATCLSCGDYIFSRHRHDFVYCTCGSIAVDGGQEYLRRVGDPEVYVDMTWSIDDAIYKACAEAVQDAIDTDRNKYGIANAVMRKLREHNSIVAEGEYLGMAYNQTLDEIMVQEPGGGFNRYKRVL
jgi:basic membrane lipoprotein Med (substrate-binding protein (PBP1-ABC) superfamily)